MDQYNWPTSVLSAELEADPRFRELRRPITAREYAQAIQWGRNAGLHRGFWIPSLALFRFF